MGDPRHDFGIAAEAAVAAWLERSGWMVLDRRRRSTRGAEVDIIALDAAEVLVAVEVRARRSARAGSGTESLDARRMARVGRTLAIFAAASASPHRGVRIDVVTVTPVAGPAARWRLQRFPGAAGQ